MAAKMHFLDQRRLIDTNGIADGSSIFFYLTGTTTLASIYADSGLSTPLANPVVVPSGAAVPVIYLDDAVTYRRRIVYSDGGVDDADPYTGGIIPGESFSGDTGADLIGATGGGTVQDALDIVQTGNGKAAIGTGVSDKVSRFTTLTSPSDDLNGTDNFFYSNQTDPDNQRIGGVDHIYADAYGRKIDSVGAKASFVTVQAHNPIARADKSGTYVGTANPYEWWRSRPFGGGVFPLGNLGSFNDRMGMLDTYGTVEIFGADAEEWDGTAEKAPYKHSSYEFFGQQQGYWGFRPGLGLELVAVNKTLGTFLPITLKASQVLPPGDATGPNPTGVGGLGFRFSQMTAVQFRPGSGSVIWTSGAGVPEGNITAPPGSKWTDESTGDEYRKASGTGNTGWVAA